MMFHSFDVMMDDLLVHAEKFEKIGQEPVTPGDLAGEASAG
jgi:hypothetical protein